MPKKFDFIEAYRKMQPVAAQEIVEARQKSHAKLYPGIKTMKNVYELCQLAFNLKQDIASLTEWLQPPIKEFDPRFSLEIDKAEAGRIASLLLRELIASGSPVGAFAVLTCSFGGLRTPIDGELLIEANEAVVEVGRAQRIVEAEKKIAAPAAKDLKAELDAVEPGNPATIRTAFVAAIGEARNAVTKTASSANDAHQALRSDVIRLAEEVDMLWWHIGDWSECLDMARTELPKAVVGVVSGVELGRFVRRVPGPFGAYGILRRTLSKLSDKKAKLKDVVDALTDRAAKLASPIPASATAVFPVHAAMLLSSKHGPEAWPSQFEENVGRLSDFELPHLDLAIQAFRERVLIKYEGLGE
jgi:hypothetical protein